MLLLLLIGCPLGKETGDSTPDSPAPSFECGETTCAGTDVCVEERLPAACENLYDSGAECPEGTTRTKCGGAGIPCCCEPAPDPTYTCQACGETPSCDCVTCATDLWCVQLSSETSRNFACERPDKP